MGEGLTRTVGFGALSRLMTRPQSTTNGRIGALGACACAPECMDRTGELISR